MASVWKRLQRVGKHASKFQFVASYQELMVECTKKWWVVTACMSRACRYSYPAQLVCVCVCVSASTGFWNAELARDVSYGDDLSIPPIVPVCRERLAICNYTFPHQFVIFSSLCLGIVHEELYEISCNEARSLLPIFQQIGCRSNWM